MGIFSPLLQTIDDLYREPQILLCSVQNYMILPLVLCEFGTWSLILREERRLRVLENRVLRRIFGLRRDEVAWEWCKRHNEELNVLYSPNIIRVIKSR